MDMTSTGQRHLVPPQTRGHATDESPLREQVTAAQRGDPTALAALVEHFRIPVFRYVLSRVSDRSLAEDITQDVCLAIVTAVPHYQEMGRPFAAFVFGIAGNKIAEAVRKSARRREDATAELPDLGDSAPGPEDHAVVHDAVQRTLALLDGLPDVQREVILLRVAAGLSAEETAAALGMTPGAIRVLQHRALSRLRQRVTAEVQS